MASNSGFVSRMVFGAGIAFCLHCLECPPHLREISHFLFLLSEHQKQMKKTFHSYAKNKVTLTRWLKPLNPRAFIDRKLRLHPSPTRTYLDISQDGILSAEGDFTFGRKLDRAGLPMRDSLLFPPSHSYSGPVTLLPSVLFSWLPSSSFLRLSLIIFMFNMSKRENSHSVTLN